MSVSETAAFRFKQFSICQNRAAMKVGFDGILLGAWSDCSNCQRVLDVGTGTGLVALMLAQRTASTKHSVQIDAIEVDDNALLDADMNIRNSPWSRSVRLVQASFQHWFANWQESNESQLRGQDTDTDTHAYDLIVSNPPYFQHAPSPTNGSRERARHDVALTVEEILSASVELLTDTGKCCLIIPMERLSAVETVCRQFELFVVRKLLVRSLPIKSPHRVLLEIRRQPAKFADEELTIESQHHTYTEAFRRLAKEFYLAF